MLQCVERLSKERVKVCLHNITGIVTGIYLIYGPKKLSRDKNIRRILVLLKMGICMLKMFKRYREG